jgi:hypothetical protein
MTDELVNWVEKLCDAVEALDDSVFKSRYATVNYSVPATVAAIRVHYYVNGSHRSGEIYKRINYLLNEYDKWNDMELDEQKGLLEHIGFNSIIVYRSGEFIEFIEEVP